MQFKNNEIPPEVVAKKLFDPEWFSKQKFYNFDQKEVVELVRARRLGSHKRLAVFPAFHNGLPMSVEDDDVRFLKIETASKAIIKGLNGSKGKQITIDKVFEECPQLISLCQKMVKEHPERFVLPKNVSYFEVIFLILLYYKC